MQPKKFALLKQSKTKNQRTYEVTKSNQQYRKYLTFSNVSEVKESTEVQKLHKGFGRNSHKLSAVQKNFCL